MTYDLIIVTQSYGDLIQMTQNCIDSARLDNADLNIIIVETGNPYLYNVDKIIEYNGEFNYNRALNLGLKYAKGDYILYLDIDDMFGDNHLKNISEGLKNYDWVWFDDIRYFPKTKEWYQNPCDIRVISRHGTSNICHKRTLPYKWDHDGYAHDFYFIKHLKQNTNFTKIHGGEYYVAHVPNSGNQTIKGYDI